MRLMKISMAVIDPDLNTPVRVELFNDNVGRVILVHVDGCDGNRRLTRVDREACRSAGSADTHTECISASAPPKTAQGYAVWLLIVVEVRNNESLPELPAGKVAATSFDGGITGMPILRTQTMRCQKHREDADLAKTQLH
jgi:hypothetical protein